MQETIRSLNKLLDLDLAIIEDSYQSVYSARLQQTERLATLGQVAGGVAHELRNPLNVMKTSVYYLMNALNPTPEKKAEHLKRIERHIDLADNVISALSRFAKMPVPNLCPVRIATCVHEALEMNGSVKGVAVELAFTPELSSVLADGDQLRIVFVNLIRNACDAMPAGGRLAIEGRQTDGTVEVAIRDEGVGIPPDNLARIMEPLYSTKARGLGLGLAIARSILEKNQGSLHLTSQVGCGSTFTVRLTAAPDGEGTGS